MLQTDNDFRMVVLDTDEKNPADVHRASMEEWVSTVAQLWDAVGKDVEKDMPTLDRYCKQLRDVPLGLLEIGVDYAIKNNAYKTIPAVGMIYEGIRGELVKLNLPPKTDMDTMIERWIEKRFECGVKRFR